MTSNRFTPLLTCISLISADLSLANNLHERTIRAIVAPLIDDAIRPDSGEKNLGIRLSLAASPDLPSALSYRIEAVSKASPAKTAGLEAGLYELVVLTQGREIFRKKFLALPDLRSDLRLSYQKLEGFSLRQVIELPALQFAKSRKDLESSSIPVLEYLAALLQDEPDIDVLRIEVHTDSGGREARNLALTQARSEEISRFLRGKGVAPQRLIAQGMGSAQPVLPNSSYENRLANRRVEYVLEKVQDRMLLGQKP